MGVCLFTGASRVSRAKLEEAFTALRDDLVHDGGPRISTMRGRFNYAIVQYPPDEEFALRAKVQELVSHLATAGWTVHTVSLLQLLLRRLDGLGEATVRQIIEIERKLSALDAARGLAHLRTKLAPHLEGPSGIAADVSAEVESHLAAHPDHADRTVVLVGRAGALYPFFRLSALLKHLDDRTRKVPVILLYPGTRLEGNRLSFMGRLDPDGDYRPRIYP
jgi:BREX protein BrxB